MNDHRDETEDKIRRALEARSDATTVSPDALDAIRTRRTSKGWVRPATYAAVAAAIVLIAGVALINLPEDDAGIVDSAVTTTSTVPEYPTVTRPDPYPTTAPPETTQPPENNEGNGPGPADQVRAGLVVWPLDGTGASSADDAAISWIEEVLGVSSENGVERPIAENSGDAALFVVPQVGEDGAPRYDVEGLNIWVGTANGTEWFVTEAGSGSPRIDLVEHNGSGRQLRVTGAGEAFEGTGLLWVNGVGPEIVSLGANGVDDEFSVVVPWTGETPVRVRLETGRAITGEVPGVHAFASVPAPATTDIVVVDVADDDVLNVRSAAGVASDIAFTLEPFARAISHTGATEFVGSDQWWEITTPEGESGWANARYLSVQREVVANTAIADEMELQAALFLRALGPADLTPAVDFSLPDPHPHGTKIGGIGIYADAPTPFVTIDDLWAGDVVIDWDPFPGEEFSEPCGDYCRRTLREFLNIRERDVTDAEFSIGPDLLDLQPNIQFHTGHDEGYYDRFSTVVAYVPAESDDVLDWRRITFAFDFIDGSPVISQVWLWGWTP